MLSVLFSKKMDVILILLMLIYVYHTIYENFILFWYNYIFF